MSYIILTLIVFQILWTLFFIKFAKNWFGPRFKYLDLKEAQENPKYEAFTRNDKKNWSKAEFYLTGIFLLPFRIFVFIGLLFLCTLACKITAYFFKIKDLEKPQPENFRKLIKFYTYIVCRIFFFTSGFFYIKKIKIKLDPKKHPNLKITNTNKNPIVTVSNHVSIMDGFYYMLEKNYSFIAKEESKNYPFIGILSKTLQSIYINRSSKSDGGRILSKLKERVQKIKNGEKLSEFVIFAEGTTTNGHCLSGFKKGAFVLDTPLKLFGLKYGGSFSSQCNMCSTLESVVGTFCNFYNRLTVFEVEGGVEFRGGAEQWEGFVKAVRRVYCEEFGFKDTGGSYRLKNEFEKKFLTNMK